MPRGKRNQDRGLLEMALIGYEAEKENIESRIREIRAALGGKTAPATAAAPKRRGGRRTLSAAARARIAAAQRKRWAEFHKREGK
jgi:hypothetical protein